jgi:hypothetical protein
MISAIHTRYGSGTAALPGGMRQGSTRAERSYQPSRRAAKLSMLPEVWTLTPRLWHGGGDGESGHSERRKADEEGG